MQDKRKTENKNPANTEEMVKLYRTGATLEAVGKEYGMTRQGVRHRFIKAGVITSPNKYERFDRHRLEKLYTHEGLSLSKIAAIFSASRESINKALKHYNIPRRKSIKKGGYKVDFLRSLEIGGKGIFEWKNPNRYIHLHTAAKQIGMKISIKSLGGDQFEITRIK